MRQDVVDAVQEFAQQDAVLCAPLDEETWVLVPRVNGCPLVFQDMGDAVAIRTGFDVEVVVDCEEEGSHQTIREVVLSLVNGKSVEVLSGVYRNRLAPCGYKVEFPGGSMKELGAGRKTFTVRLPQWNKRGDLATPRASSP